MFEWLFNKNSKKTIAKKAVGRAKKILRSRHAPALDVKVDHVWWYGAVEIDPKHCVVWIMMSGSDSERIPAHWSARDEKSVRRARESLRAEDCHWLEELAGIVEGEFRACGWEWQTPRIGVESVERVKRDGGFDYFR